MSNETINQLVTEELKKVTDEKALEWLKEHLIEPKPTTLRWEYGNMEPYPAWIVADTGERNVVIAYCEGGHGSFGNTWGLIFANDTTFGMDCSWYSDLLSAVYECGGAEAPPGWEVP